MITDLNLKSTHAANTYDILIYPWLSFCDTPSLNCTLSAHPSCSARSSKPPGKPPETTGAGGFSGVPRQQVPSMDFGPRPRCSRDLAVFLVVAVKIITRPCHKGHHWRIWSSPFGQKTWTVNLPQAFGKSWVSLLHVMLLRQPHINSCGKCFLKLPLRCGNIYSITPFCWTSIFIGSA